MALAVCGLAACQSKRTAAQLTPEQYKAKVNRICADAANLVSTIAAPGAKATSEDAGLYAQQLRQVLGPHVRQIEAIPVPPTLRPDMLAINDLFNALLRNLTVQVEAGPQNDVNKILDASDRIRSLQTSLNQRANAIGLESCATAT
ncbi:MAG: hypothetical protein QOG03_2123 [Actinomycetota bacterium]|jgi:hypothetical protein|nr:hypothetical protein [Actinomycetota bacterium]